MGFSAQQLRKLRDSAGLSQRELAERLTVGPAAISLYERGHRSPTLAGLQELALALGVRTDDLLEPEVARAG